MENASYLSSTQHRLFTFTPKSLSDLRTRTNALAQSRLSASASSSITAFDELTLLSYYTRTLLKLCTHFRTPSTVRSTAVSFLHRLYLSLSPLTTHPKTLLLPILFLALKSELGSQSTTMFIRTAAEAGLKTTKAELLAPELMIAAGLRWSFSVRHPWAGLDGVAVLLLKEGFEEGRVKRACGEARRTLTGPMALGSDAGFLFTPPQILWGGVWIADREMAKVWLGKVDEGRLLKVVKECAEVCILGTREVDEGWVVRKGGEVAEEEMQKRAVEVDKKLFLVRKAQKEGGHGKREGEEQRKEEERRRKKRKLEREKMEADDVFGGPLPGM